MAITFDAASQGDVAAAQDLTVEHTCTGTDLALYVGVDTFDTETGEAPQQPTATYDTESMALLGNTIYGAVAQKNQRISMFRKVTPTTGANDTVATLPGDTDELTLAALSFTGVDQGDPDDTAGTADIDTGTEITQDITSATGDLVVDFVAWFDQAITVGADQDNLVENDNAGGNDSVAGSSQPGAGTVTMSWDWSLDERAGQVAVNVNAAAGGGLPPRRLQPVYHQPSQPESQVFG